MSEHSGGSSDPTQGLPGGELTDSELGNLAALDKFPHRSTRYRSTEEYKEVLDLVGKISDYSLYNAALLHV